MQERWVFAQSIDAAGSTMRSLRGDFSMAPRNQVPEIRNFKEMLWWILIGMGIGGW